MKKRTSRTYFALFFALLGVLTIPKDTVERIQEQSIALANFMHPSAIPFGSRTIQSSSTKEELLKLQVENAHLKEEIVRIKNIMQHELGQLCKIESLVEDNGNFSLTPLKRRHRIELERLLNIQLQAIPAHVIYRAPSSWGSFLWINVGNTTNESLGISTIAKNSPVLVGTSVVGVVEYVGNHHSKVRLISDPNLSPSVRVARGEKQNHLIQNKIRELLQLLYAEGERFDDPQRLEFLIETLQSASSILHEDQETTFLAKGILTGSIKALWRKHTQILSGTGFNYDFSDDAGPGRDLRTGKPLPDDNRDSGIQLVKEGDLLVTTGFDGVFPAGLPTAIVTKLHPLNDSDYYYELQAIPAAGNFNDLSLVFVIPPLANEERWE